MRVSIGPYKDYIGPFQIVEALCFWVKEQPDEFGIKQKPDWVHELGCWLAEDKNGNDRWLTKLCQWIHTKRKRSVKIKIDRWDTWNADGTLSMIIVPMLEQLRDTKHGAPFVDDSDVPMELRSTNAPPKENEWDIDEYHFKRYDWILNEMIWAFRLDTLDDWESIFRSGTNDLQIKDGRLVEGPNHTEKFDEDGYNTYIERQRNGWRLFGKYFNTLWD